MVSRIPPRPDYSALLLSASTATVLYLMGTDTTLILLISFIVGVTALPLFLIAREIILFGSKNSLSYEQVETVAEWIRELGLLLGYRNVVVLYAFRKGLSLHVIQLGDISEEEAQAGLPHLIYRTIWSSVPAVRLSVKRSIIVVVPARIMETLYSLVEKSRRGIYLRATSVDHIKLVYRLLKEMIIAAYQKAGRVYVAYMATKALTDAIIKGLIRFSDTLIAEIDEAIPFEPYWVKARVKAQLAEESTYIIEA